MYAIVEIAGQQHRVEKDQRLYVHRLDAKEGEKVQLDRVLYISDGGKASIGEPVLSGASVSAKVISHQKGDKVLVFHKKRRKGYSKMNGHRQLLTELVIEGIKATGSTAAPKKEAAKPAPKQETKPAPAKAAAPKQETKPAPAKAAAPKQETKPAPAKAAAPKETKPAAPKAAAKPDDLKKVEGVGPKIAETLNAAGIMTFADLAKAKPEKIAEIIADVRGVHVTDTWPAQAKLAAEGKWDELKKWQDELDGGKK